MIIPALKHANQVYLSYYQGGGFIHFKRFLRYPIKFIFRTISKKFGLFGRTPVATRTCWGKKIFIFPPDKNAGSLYYFGFLARQEYPLSLYLARTLKENDVFYDVGANYGFYSVLAKALIKEGEIHAFEPHPLLTKCLRRSLADGIYMNEIALSDKPGEVNFYDKYVSGHSGGSTILKEVAETDTDQSNTFSVATTSLDEYVKTHTPPTIIKIDVEGAEYLVLSGGLETLKKYHPLVAIEVWGGELWEKYSLPAVNFLFKSGYVANKIGVDGELIPISKPDLVKRSLRLKYDNIVFKFSHPSIE